MNCILADLNNEEAHRMKVALRTSGLPVSEHGFLITSMRFHRNTSYVHETRDVVVLVLPEVPSA